MMVESCVGPSELHLKKELTALRRARFLRDPATCSSLLSPLSARSFVATSELTSGNGFLGNSERQNKYGALLETPSEGEKNSKKVYLYNWKHHSGKYSQNGKHVDCEGNQLSATNNPDDNSSNSNGVDSKSDTYLDDPLNLYNIASRSSHTTVKRTSRKLRSSFSKKGVIKHSSAALKLLDITSNSFGVLDSGERSDDTGNCTSEDLQQLIQGLARKTSSCSASPLYSGSGCGNWYNSSRILKVTRRDGSSQSCTPASTSSYYKYGAQNRSTVGSWDGTAASFDEDELEDADLQKSQGCGIPCYWSKKSKDRALGGYYSPSLSDTFKRKGNDILCGSQTMYNKKNSSISLKQKYLSKSSQGLPLLNNISSGAGSSTDSVSDELSVNFGELDLEALSRLDGRRWSSCKSQECMEIAILEGANSESEDRRSLSRKYRPRSFDEIVGQSIVVHSLTNAILKGRIAPAYLFQGPRGTGKTSVARIFAASLNCLSTAEVKPCWFCKECTAFYSRNGTNLREVDATDKKGLEEVIYLLEKISSNNIDMCYKIFIIDECHMLSGKIWSALIKFLEEPLPRVAFIFVTIDSDNLPSAIISRCQKYIFSKVKDVDIVSRLRKLSEKESLDVDFDALDLIALNSDGSMRDAETMLDQLSLLGKRITTTLVNDLVGVVSDEKLLDLLEVAMSSDTAETVKRSRELMDSGIDPIALMSQLASLIMDIIAGTYQLVNLKSCGTALGGRNLTETELERLQQALKILSDAEKQLRLSSERSTWFTAALLQLGSSHNSEPNKSSGSSSKLSSRNIYNNGSDIANNSTTCENRMSQSRTVTESSEANDSDKKMTRFTNQDRLDEIWQQCIDRCHSKTLKQLLRSHGKLISITESEGVLVAYAAFEDKNAKARAQRFLSSITNSIEIVLRQNVQVKIGLIPYKVEGLKPGSESSMSVSTVNINHNRVDIHPACYHLSLDRNHDSSNLPSNSLNSTKAIVHRAAEKCENSALSDKQYPACEVPITSPGGKCDSCNSKAIEQDISRQITQLSNIDEQRLDKAWLHAAERHVPGFANQPKPEKNQVLPQNGVACQAHSQSSISLPFPSIHCGDEVYGQLKTFDGSESQQTEQIGGVHHSAISPSFLHSNSYTANIDNETQGYESGPGCNGLLCWKTQKTQGRKVNQGIHVGSQKASRLSLFGQCGKLKLEDKKIKN